MPAHGREAPGVGHSRSTGATADATGRSPRPGSPAPAVRPGFAEMPIYGLYGMECDSAQFDCGPTSLDMASGGLERQQLSVAERIQIHRESKNELAQMAKRMLGVEETSDEAAATVEDGWPRRMRRHARVAHMHGMRLCD